MTTTSLTNLNQTNHFPRQLLPQNRGSFVEQFTRDRQTYRDILSQKPYDLSNYITQINPYPFVISPSELETQVKIVQILYKALNAIVRNYLRDIRIQRIIALPPTVKNILQKLEADPYKIGYFRPDFLYDLNGKIKICEINARFPVNGFLISHYLNEIIPQLDYIPKTYQSIFQLSEIIHQIFYGLTQGNIGIVKGWEEGGDIHLLHDELNRQGLFSKIITPDSLQVQHELLSDRTTSFKHLILELHQPEILNLPLAILDHLTQSSYLNDLRTIFLVHDKRMLAVLHNITIMQDYLTFSEARFLSSHIVPTYPMNAPLEILWEVTTQPQDWLLKPCQLGKGLGIMLGNSSSKEVWLDQLKTCIKTDFVLQNYVPQKQFPILAEVNQKVTINLMNVVGTMLNYNDQFLGSGVYRASSEKIVNVSNGAQILFPIVES